MVKLTFFFSSFTSPETCNNKKMQINIRDQVSSQNNTLFSFLGHNDLMTMMAIQVLFFKKWFKKLGER